MLRPSVIILSNNYAAGCIGELSEGTPSALKMRFSRAYTVYRKNTQEGFIMNRTEIKEQSKQMLSGRWGRFALYTLLFFVLSGILNADMRGSVRISFGNADAWQTFWTPALLWKTPIRFVCQIIFTFILYGYTQILIKTRAGLPTGVEDMFTPFTAMPQRVIGAAVVNFVIRAVYTVLLAAVSMLSFFVPFLAVLLGVTLSVFYFILMLRLSMVPIILLENPYTTVTDAFVQSYNVMRGYTLDYFVLLLSFLGWLILGALTLGILYLWITPYLYLSQVNFYYDIKAKQLRIQ